MVSHSSNLSPTIVEQSSNINNYNDVNAAMNEHTIPAYTPVTTSEGVTNSGHNYQQSMSSNSTNDNNYNNVIYTPVNPVTSSENVTNLQSMPLNQQNQPQQSIVPSFNTLNTLNITVNSPTNLFGCRITISISNGEMEN